ncbi:hypothetical protein M011DRAFT_474872 [Sporormia fimetaria CBS 119925]|uniref:Uncharacterized protein n=1 Tax=Sporormia fimetaria CBS 119925 TaxID=1340428 RepID=A0A6A6VL35_9PLEO|nr:hypothetical protein M011DRAFT_474872 [Sporormia fimetaria CBS 119925]
MLPQLAQLQASVPDHLLFVLPSLSNVTFEAHDWPGYTPFRLQIGFFNHPKKGAHNVPLWAYMKLTGASRAPAPMELSADREDDLDPDKEEIWPIDYNWFNNDAHKGRLCLCAPFFLEKSWCELGTFVRYYYLLAAQEGMFEARGLTFTEGSARTMKALCNRWFKYHAEPSVDSPRNSSMPSLSGGSRESTASESTHFRQRQNTDDDSPPIKRRRAVGSTPCQSAEQRESTTHGSRHVGQREDTDDDSPPRPPTRRRKTVQTEKSTQTDFNSFPGETSSIQPRRASKERHAKSICNKRLSQWRAITKYENITPPSSSLAGAGHHRRATISEPAESNISPDYYNGPSNLPLPDPSQSELQTILEGLRQNSQRLNTEIASMREDLVKKEDEKAMVEKWLFELGRSQSQHGAWGQLLTSC